MAVEPSVTLTLGGALAMSLVVERVVEFSKNVLDILPIGGSGRIVPPEADVERELNKVVEVRQAAADRHKQEVEAESTTMALRKELDNIRQELGKTHDAAKRAELERQIKEATAAAAKNESVGEWDERVPGYTVLVQPATDPDDGTTLRAFVIQILAIVVGILIAHFGKLRLFEALLPGGLASREAIDYLLTGLVIAGGSKPVHLLIRFLTERRIPAEVASAVEVEQAAATPVTARTMSAASPAAIAPVAVTIAHPDTGDWADIDYAGGVDRERLENVHRRGREPNLIIYHHTAMRRESTMSDLVRVIKSRKDANGKNWITAYNCVILADGSINGFCRWDRYGSHAAGSNRLSLGLTFMGNFETDARVPFANPDGRYGPARPTEEQLHAGARVVVLWSRLYTIPLTFDQTVIPHRQISPKTCPGGNFPDREFRDLVRYYDGRWSSSSFAKERLNAFSLKPFIYDNPARNPLVKAVP